MLRESMMNTHFDLTALTRALHACAMACIIAAAPVHAGNETQPVKDAARAGHQLGQSMLGRQRANEPTYTEQGGRHGEGAVVLPGAGVVPLSDVVPGADMARANAIGQIIQDDVAREAAIAQSQQQAATDSSLAAQAYRTGRNSKGQSKVDQLQADAQLWRQADAVRTNEQAIDADLANCKTTTLFQEEVEQGGGTVSQEQTCETLHVPDQATVSRELSTRRDEATLMQRTLRITQEVTLEVDSAQGLGDGDVLGDVQLTMDWTGQVAAVAITQAPSAFNDWRGSITITPHTPLTDPSGETMTLTVTAQRLILQDRISTAPQAPLMGSDAFCTAQWTCEDNAPRTVDGVLVDGAIAAALRPLYPPDANNNPPSASQPLCWRASATYQCPFNIGSMGCWVTPTGEQRCHTTTPGEVTQDTCQGLRSRSDCRPVRSTCNDQARGYGDFCYVETQVYECQRKVDVPEVIQKQRTQCTGALACIGDNCIERADEHATGWTRAQAALSVVQHMLGDRRLSTGQATIVNHPVEQDTPQTPAKTLAAPARVPAGQAEWFAGEAYECRKATGSTLDCCGITQGQGNRTWREVYQRHTRRANAPRVAQVLRQAGVPEQGSWHDLNDAGRWSLASLNKPLFSMIEEIGAGGPMPGEGEGEDPSMAPVLAQYLQEQQAQPDPNWQCTAAERTLATMREAGLCEAVGSYCQPNASGACVESRNVYCCYNSPMSKQLTLAALGGEQAIANGALGTALAPQCGGVGQAVIESIRPDRVDTAEWRGRFQDGGGYPTAASMRANYSQQALTGDGSALATPGQHRPTIGERVGARLDGNKLDAARKAMQLDARGHALAPQAEPNVAGEIALAPTFNSVAAGRIAIVSVRRTGGAGSVSVHYATADDSAHAPTDYEATSGTLTWGAGETGEKTFTVKTLQAAAQASGSAGKSIAIRLDSPTGGASLGEAAGEVRITAAGQPATGGGTPRGQLSMSQTLIWSAPSLDQMALAYQINLINSGQGPVTNPVLRFRAERTTGDIMVFDYGSSPNQMACSQTSVPGNPVTCAPNLTLQPGEGVVLSVVFNATQTGPLTTWCSGQAGSASGPIEVSEAQCQATTQVTEPGGDSGEWAGCLAGNLVTYGTLAIDEFQTLFAGTPEQNLGSVFMVGPERTRAVGFRAPLALGTRGTVTLGPVPPLAGSFPVYARLSRCAGDLSPPMATATNPWQNAQCTFATVQPDGALGNAGSMRWVTSQEEEGRESAQGCTLTPGERYYLNVSALDMTHFPQTGIGTPTCLPGSSCSSSVFWHVEQAPANSIEPAAKTAVQTAPASVPDNCPAPPTGFARADRYASFETVFMDAKGRRLAHPPFIDLNRQQYAAIPFIAPTDGATLHRLDWEQGSGTNALVTISRCPGDVGTRTDDAIALAEACIGTPDGQPRKKGTLIFQGGGSGEADKTCRLFPGRLYYINVFRLGVPGTEDQANPCSGHGQFTCGPRISVR